MENPGKICSRREIVEQAWEIQFKRGTYIVEMNIKRLREKMDTGFETRIIETERGKKYKLKADS